MASHSGRAELSGTVTDQTGQPVLSRLAVIFTADERRWAEGDPSVRIVPLDAGRFLFPDLDSGRYHLAVVDDVERDEWLEPEALRLIARTSIQISIGEAEHKVQDVRIR
jgi:hypothetical protein